MTEPFDWAGLVHTLRQRGETDTYLNLVAYLRERIEAAFVPVEQHSEVAQVALVSIRDATARAEAAEAQNAKLREALRNIVDGTYVGKNPRAVNSRSRYGYYEGRLWHRARAALGGEHDK